MWASLMMLIFVMGISIVSIVEQKILQNILHYQILLKQYISTLHKKFVSEDVLHQAKKKHYIKHVFFGLLA